MQIRGDPAGMQCGRNQGGGDDPDQRQPQKGKEDPLAPEKENRPQKPGGKLGGYQEQAVFLLPRIPRPQEISRNSKQQKRAAGGEPAGRCREV